MPVAKDSYTARSLIQSARPSEISPSLASHPYGLFAVEPTFATITVLDDFNVFVFAPTTVLVNDARTCTWKSPVVPKTVVDVIVKVPLPAPLVATFVPVISIISPASPLPPVPS